MEITIVGGGLVGSLAACIFGQKGHKVQLYESRPDPNSAAGKLLRGRSINLALSNRGRATLRRAGLEELVLSKAIPMRGRMLHGQNGSVKAVLYDPVANQCIYSVSRRYLNELLLQEAAALPNVSVNFNCKLIDADAGKGLAKFRKKDDDSSEEETLVEKRSDLIIGADGAHSALRQTLLKRPMTNFSQKYIQHGYIELYIPATDKGEFALEKNHLHIWPRDRFMLIALPNLDGSFTVTLFMPFEIFDTLNTEEKVLTFFDGQFPDAVPLLGRKNLCHDFLTTKPSTLISISCCPMNGGKAVLVGDAAHAMVPFYGQGMNAGFEDILILEEIIPNSDLSSGAGVEKYLEQFSTARSSDAQAICELAMYNYEEMRHLVNQKSYYWRRMIDIGLNKLLGQVWTPLYTSVTFSATPYSKCIENKKWQDKVISKMYAYMTVAVGASVATYLVSRYQRESLTDLVVKWGREMLQQKL
ncbi:kynurenine 3-monooxygenase [Folsomia candida]|uniref:kynurenine 3-monooxygenase n=1 Tax=Folsomia candida TaxID=158441 RepID=UPI000B8F6BC3|nr:kynurenine 3-monooxygenase [Folsomia candida]